MRHGPETDITFYEELGVEQTAPGEQVREAYRSLARLLHPDQQTDPQLKAMAETQMRKLNRIYGVLSDPGLRADYDALLRAGYGEPTLALGPEVPAPPRGTALRRAGKLAGALLAAGAVAGGVIWTTGGAIRDEQEYPSGQLQKPMARSAGSTAGEPMDEVERLRADVRALEAERNSALEELARVRGAGRSASKREIRALAALPSPETAGAEQPAIATRSTFGGTWYWTHSMQPASEVRGSYPPDFVEATLTETNGVIKGTYKARYRVPDGAINPEVSFEFAATLAGPILFCPWAGPGGARGEVMVRQTAKDSLQVDWTATELGNRQRIPTGSAVLARKME